MDTCQAVETAPGPHPGCAEFAPPDEWQCDQPARWVETLTIEFNGSQPVEHATTRVCDRHRTDCDVPFLVICEPI